MSISVVDFIHDYFGVDYYIVFDVAHHKASVLAEEMDQVIDREAEINM